MLFQVKSSWLFFCFHCRDWIVYKYIVYPGCSWCSLVLTPVFSDITLPADCFHSIGRHGHQPCCPCKLELKLRFWVSLSALSGRRWQNSEILESRCKCNLDTKNFLIQGIVKAKCRQSPHCPQTGCFTSPSNRVPTSPTNKAPTFHPQAGYPHHPQIAGPHHPHRPHPPEKRKILFHKTDQSKQSVGFVYNILYLL